MTLNSIRNNNVVKIPTVLVLSGLLGVSIFFFKFQRSVDAEQDIRIEQKVDKNQFNRFEDRMFEQLDRIEGKIP